MTTVEIEGETCELMVSLSDTRAIVCYGGLYVFADRKGEGWELSGVPARGEEEMAALRALTAPNEGVTTTTVIVPDLPEDGVPRGIAGHGTD